MSSGVFKGGTVRWPPLWPNHENFLQPTLYKKVRFWPKMGEFVVSFEHSEAKSVSTSGGLLPLDPPTRGSAPGPRWGLRPDFRYRLALHALAMPPPLPNSKYATGHVRF